MSFGIVATRAIIHQERPYKITVMEVREDRDIFREGVLLHWIAIIEEQGREHPQKIVYTQFSARDREEALDEIEKCFRKDWVRDQWTHLLIQPNGASSAPKPRNPIVLIDEYTGATWDDIELSVTFGKPEDH